MSPFPLLLAIVIAVALAGYALYVAIPVLKAMRETKPLMAAAVPYSQQPESASVRILVIGDSTAVGTGGTPESSIAGRLGSRYPGALIVNDSENGLKLDAFVERLRARQDEQYDLILFQIGANDIVGLTPESSMRERLHTALGLAESMAPQTLVMSGGNVGLAPVFRWPLSALYTERARNARELYLTVIRAYPTADYVDLFNERGAEPFNTDINRYYAPDHFHPSGDGYGLWFKKVEALLPE